MIIHRWRILVIGILCVLGATAIAFHIGQHITRGRAQRTADEVQHLEVGKSNVCQIFYSWQKEWQSRLSFQGTCDDANGFYMDIDVQYPPNVWPTCFLESMNGIRFAVVETMCGIARVFTGKPLAFRARVEARKGTVTRKVSQVFTLVPDDSSGGSLLLPALLNGIASTSSQLHTHGHEQATAQQQKLHPSYLVLSGRSRVNADYMPGLRVFFIEAEVTPDAGKDITEKLFHFDLSCLAHVQTCSQKDLMPDAYERYHSDELQSVSQPPQ
jgi:hypothetical protein